MLSWNKSFAAAGCGPAVVDCVASGDADFPADYAPGDARFSVIHMTNPESGGLLGYGPSVVDFRSGQILAAQARPLPTATWRQPAPRPARPPHTRRGVMLSTLCLLSAACHVSH